MTKSDREAIIQQLVLMTGYAESYYEKLSDERLEEKLHEEVGRRHG